MSVELLTADQVGHMLDVDRTTIYRMAADGRLPAVKVGRQWRFPAEQVRGLLGAIQPPRSAPRTRLDGTVTETMIELLAESLGVMMVVTDMYGRPVTSVANPCPWFAARLRDDELIADCVDEWGTFAADPDFAPRFRLGRHGFECARAFVRNGTELVGMVLAGGVAPDDRHATGDGLYHLDEFERERVLEMLPRLAASLSRLIGHDSTPDREPATASAAPTARTDS